MTPEARGVYRELLDACWGEPDCSLPNDDATLAGLAGITQADWLAVRAQVLAWFDESAGRISNARALHEWKKAKKFRAASRVAGKKGGKAKAAKKLQSGQKASDPTATLAEKASDPLATHVAKATSPSPSPPPTTTTTAVVVLTPNNGARNTTPFSPERRRLIASGESYLDALCAASPDQDRGWLLRKYSLVPPGVPGAGSYLLSLDAGSDKHLTRTVHNLREASEKLPGAQDGTRGGLLTPEAYELQRRG